MAAAVKEGRNLTRAELEELTRINQQMWAQLPESYQWLKDWEYV